MRRLALAVVLMVAMAGRAAEDWPGFRGPNGDGTVARLPETWSVPKLVWKAAVSGECHAGMAVAEGLLVTPDHDGESDLYRCLDAMTGQEKWVRRFANGRELQYGPAPRANPLIRAGRVYVQSAFGELRCLDLKTGATLWERDFRKDLGARGVPTWGFSASPILAGGKLIVHPNNLAALDPETGKTLWEGPAAGPNYSTPITGVFGGVEQVITFDGNSLGGWELAGGRRLWRLPVESEEGYIVPSPVNVGGRLLIAPGKEGSRLLGFDAQDRVLPDPLAANERLASEVPTPTIISGRILAAPGLFLLDGELKPLWQSDRKDRALRDDVHIIASKDRALAFNTKGQATLLAVRANTVDTLGTQKLCERTLMHPSIAAGRIYVRDAAAIHCYDLMGE